ncbi:TlpA disulfide reductase family protein [Kordia sp.]|uniref:TlpA family protein disulfide reductase n=1 Tax=Kordia sp. TaxID=1965332 RepID=UPI0025B96E07|nr:TlpA disulfide reductase family protein [Kordia sp.]MCH2193262.1 TlpA family protein disulfide reductase [Kordia sp.]
MLKHLFLPLCCLLCFTTVQAQEYYKAKNSPKIYTKGELDKVIQSLNNKLKTDISITTVSYTIEETIKRNDSIINFIRYDFDRKVNRTGKIYDLENKPFPDFKLRNVKGEKITQKGLKGKITFINIWFVNCYPCRREMPLLNILHEKYKDKVDFKSITFDTKEKVKTFLETNAYTFEHLVNAKSFIKNDLGVKIYPMIMIVDKDGIVRYVDKGIPPRFDKKTKKVLDFTEKDLAYLETILDDLLK